jgi:hypothetical protein
MRLGRQLGVHGLLTFYLNGYPLAQVVIKRLRLAPGAIRSFQIRRPSAAQPVPLTRADIWLEAPALSVYQA